MTSCAVFISCPFKAVAGIPCPGCGGLRAADALLHGHFVEALTINPLSVAVCLFLALSFVWILMDLVRGRDTYLRICFRKWGRNATIAAVAILLGNWVWNICKGL